MHIYVNIRYMYIPDGLEEGNDGDVPKVCLLHQRRESTERTTVAHTVASVPRPLIAL